MEHGVGVRTSQSGCWLLQQDAQHVALSGSAQHWHVTQSPKSIRYTHTHTQWNVSDMDVRQQQCSSHQQQISAALIAQPNSDWGSSYQNSMLWFCHDLLAALKPSAHLTWYKINVIYNKWFLQHLLYIYIYIYIYIYGIYVCCVCVRWCGVCGVYNSRQTDRQMDGRQDMPVVRGRCCPYRRGRSATHSCSSRHWASVMQSSRTAQHPDHSSMPPCHTIHSDPHTRHATTTHTHMHTHMHTTEPLVT